MYHEEHSLLNGHFTQFLRILYITVKQIPNNSGAIYCIFCYIVNVQIEQACANSSSYASMSAMLLSD